MRRYVHNFLATLVCVCLLISYTPLPASADQGGESAPAPSVGDMGWVDPATGTATTQLHLLAVDGLTLSITPDFAASIDEIRGNQKFDLKVQAAGTEPFAYAWSRAVLDENGQPGPAQPIEGADAAEYPLSQHADTLETGKAYRYTVLVTDGSGASKEASVTVTVSNGYMETTLPDETALPRVHGLSIHSLAELAAEELDARSAPYGFLQQAAEGMKLDPSAWQLALAGAPEGKAAFVGELQVTLPLSAEAAAAGDAVKVLGLGPDGSVVAYDAAVDAGGASVTFVASALGAFAVAYPAPAGSTFSITATAGEGGAITPDGVTEFAAGSTAVYTVLPDAGYVVDSVEVDGSPVELTGNAYTFERVQADHRIEAAFAKAEVPDDPQKTHTVVARVEGGNGRVALGEGAPDGHVEASVLEGASTTVTFVPDDGFAVQSVTVRTGEGDAQPVNVFGNSFLISAVTADVEVVVTYKAGIAPPTPLHEVTASSTGSGTVSPQAQTVPHAGTARVTVLPDEGNRVASLLVDGVESRGKLGDDGVLTLQNVVRDMKVQVAFEAIPSTFAITATAGQGGTITPSGIVTVRVGEDAVFRIAANEGFELDSLLVDGEPAEAVDGVYTFEDVRADHAIAAAFKPAKVDPPEPTYATISAVAGPNGRIDPSGDVQVELGSSYTFALLPNAGYEVDQVLLDGEDARGLMDGPNSLTLPKVERDMTLSVTFKLAKVDPPEPVTHVVEASATTGGSISPRGSIDVVEGKDARFTFAADEGYRLAKLVIDSEDRPAAASYTFEDVRAAHTIRAVFERIPVDPPTPAYVTVHATAGAGGSISPAGDVRVLHGSSQMFALLPSDGYAVDQVTVDGRPVAAAGSVLTLFDLTQETTVRVTFKRSDQPVPPVTTHTITAKTGAHGAISPAGATKVIEGGSVLYSLIPDAGYHVDVLTVDGVTYEGYDRLAYRFEDVAEDHQISVTFAPDQKDEPVQEYVTVHASADTGGSISPAGDVRLPKGATQTFFFLAEQGKRVSELTVDGKTFAFSGSSYTLFNATADTSIAVRFADDDADEPAPAPTTYTVSSSAGEHGSVWPSGDTTVIEGGSLLLTFVPEEGYEVDEVSVGGTVVQHGGVSYRVKDVVADTSVAVTFAKKAQPEPDVPLVTVDVKVEVSTESGEGGMVSPSGAFAMAQGGSQTFHVFPEEGYDLDAVTVNGDQVDVEPLYAPAMMMARSVPGAAGGYRFAVENVTDDTVISVRFKALGEGDPVPTPVPVHEVTASASSGGMISPSGTAWVPTGGSLAYTVKADAGWHLASLSAGGQDVTDQVSGNVFTLADVTGDTDVRAEFEADEPVPEPSRYVTVHATSSRGGAVTPGGDVRVNRGESQTFAFVPDDGFVLESVEVDGRPVIPIDGTYTLFDLEADAAVHATFREKQPDDPDPVVPTVHEVRAAASTVGGTVQPAGLTKVAHGSSLLFTFFPEEGYELDRVVLNGDQDVTEEVKDLTYRLVNVTEDCTLEASFKSTAVTPPEPSPTYKVTSASSEGGSIQPEGTFEVAEGGSMTFAMQADDGYRFASLVVNDVDVTEKVRNGSYELEDVRKDTSVYARFARESVPPATLHVIEAGVSGGHGRVSPEGAVRVVSGSDQDFYFIPDEGYVVDAVMVDGRRLAWSPNGYRFEDVRADHTLVVTFKTAGVPGGAGSNPVKSLMRAVAAKTGDGNGAAEAALIALAAGALAVGIVARRRMQDRAQVAHGEIGRG